MLSLITLGNAKKHCLKHVGSDSGLLHVTNWLVFTLQSSLPQSNVMIELQKAKSVIFSCPFSSAKKYQIKFIFGLLWIRMFDFKNCCWVADLSFMEKMIL